jgi:hypothetical protein
VCGWSETETQTYQMKAYTCYVEEMYLHLDEMKRIEIYQSLNEKQLFPRFKYHSKACPENNKSITTSLELGILVELTTRLSVQLTAVKHLTVNSSPATIN